MVRHQLFALLLWATFSSCAQNTREQDSIHELRKQAKRDTVLAREFQKKYSAYIVKPSRNLPDFLRSETTISKSPDLTVSNGDLRLRLILGERRTVAENPTSYRTSSRYQLFARGDSLASAESTIARGDSDSTVLVLADAGGQAFLVAEELCWTTARNILFYRVSDSGSEPRWEARNVSIPYRDNAFGPSEFPKPLGIHNGKVYLKEDGIIYAIPFNILKDDPELAFGIG